MQKTSRITGRVSEEKKIALSEVAKKNSRNISNLIDIGTDMYLGKGYIVIPIADEDKQALASKLSKTGMSIESWLKYIIKRKISE